MTITWPKIFGSSPENSLLPLYDACSVAKFQRWFGLYPSSTLMENGHSLQANKGTPTENGECGRLMGSESDVPGHDTGPRSYIARNEVWFYLFSFGAWLGDDEFYFMLFSMIICNLSWWVSRRMLLTWGFCMYIGQSTKELLKWPRPSEPPVVRMEGRYLMEYGMPSTHAMVGTLMPFSYLIGTWNHYEVRFLKTITFSWLIAVCKSGWGEREAWVILIFLNWHLSKLFFAIKNNNFKNLNY